ncbi:MAG: DUF86 domain-containing protein [Gammaproteobacteria bacterium]|nr:DUF86 domain-containing protein [Gammaproteobacteria bacterium]
MQLEEKALLHDIHSAGVKVQNFTSGKTFEDYQGDDMMRAAVERQFEIIGEALSLLAKRNKELAAHISAYQRIISFRNILIHGYARVDDRLVWSVVEERLGILLDEVRSLSE